MTEIATQELARARAAQIRAGIQNYLSTLANVAAAYQQRDWKALGYPSWDAYVDGEYGADRLRLSPEHRQKAVAELRLAGMSQRAIASAVGVSQETVRRDLSGDTSESPDEIQGADGKTYASTRPTNSPSGPIAPSVSATDQDRTGPDLPPRSGEADARLDTAVGAALSEASTGMAVPAETGESPVVSVGEAGTTGDIPDPLEDREALEQQHRERSSEAVAEALVAIRMRLEPDPVRWLNETWIPGSYRFRDMPRVRDSFTADGLRTSAKYLEMLADHLDQNGEVL